MTMNLNPIKPRMEIIKHEGNSLQDHHNPGRVHRSDTMYEKTILDLLKLIGNHLQVDMKSNDL